MVDKTVVKMGLLLVILTSLIGFWQWDRHNAYRGGYDAGKAEQLAQYQAAEEAARIELGEAVEEKKHWQQVAIELQSRPPITVTKYVTKIIENNPDCTVINGFSELWNAARANYSSGGNPGN